MGSTSGFVLGVAVVVVAAFLFWQFYGRFGLPWIPNLNNQEWAVNISVDPYILFDAPQTEPSGLVILDKTQSLTVTATGTHSWAFRYWLFDNASVSEQPIITIEAQTVNTTHSLVAVFAVRNPTFEITPDMTFTKGTVFSTSLQFTNNGDATIRDVQIKLNDPSGVFKTFLVVAEPVYMAGTYAGDIENKWLSTLRGPYVCFTLNTNHNSDAWLLPAHSTKTFYVGTPNKSQVSETINAGVYHLTFEIRFTVVSGEFSNPPDLTIPWDVTVLG
jgi:hypothetical protein